MFSVSYFNGNLTITSKEKTKMDYGVIEKTPHDIRFKNITSLLSYIYSSSNPYIFVRIKAKDGSLNVSAVGKLSISLDYFGVSDWHIGAFPLGLILFNNTKKDVEIVIKHLEKQEYMKYKNKSLKKGVKT